MVLEIDETLLLGQRQIRNTYRHPTDPALVLKIEVRSRPRRTRWYQRPVNIASSMERELRGYADLLVRLGRHEPFVCRILGLENTDQGPAILAENATIGTVSHINLRDLLKRRIQGDFTLSDVTWAKGEYGRITTMFQELGIYNQSARPENAMLCRMPDGSLCLRLYDFKTLVYRQLISPRYVPGAQRYEQNRVIQRTLKLFDDWVAAEASN